MPNLWIPTFVGMEIKSSHSSPHQSYLVSLFLTGKFIPAILGVSLLLQHSRHRASFTSHRNDLKSLSHDVGISVLSTDEYYKGSAKGDKILNVIIDTERCKGCRYCISVCPKKIIVLATHINQSGSIPAVVISEKAGECIGCLACARMCPDTAITIGE